jgi:hypothetical protein
MVSSLKNLVSWQFSVLEVWFQYKEHNGVEFDFGVRNIIVSCFISVPEVQWCNVVVPFFQCCIYNDVFFYFSVESIKEVNRLRRRQNISTVNLNNCFYWEMDYQGKKWVYQQWSVFYDQFWVEFFRSILSKYLTEKGI